MTRQRFIPGRKCGCPNNCQETSSTIDISESLTPQQRSCCAECGDGWGPCHFYVFSPCPNKAKIRDSTVGEGEEPIVAQLMPGGVDFIQLKKVCITGCEWVAGRLATGDAKYDAGSLFDDVVGVQDAVFPARNPELDNPINLGCTLAEIYAERSLGTDPETPALDEFNDLVDKIATWRMVLADGGATLTYAVKDLVTGEVLWTIVYEAATFNCYGATTFTISTESLRQFWWFTRKTCVIPENAFDESRYEQTTPFPLAHFCETSAQQCACCDNGLCQLPAYIKFECPSGAFVEVTFDMTRYVTTARYEQITDERVFGTGCAEGNPTLPAEIAAVVPDVSTLPCGLFYGMSGGIGMVVWCDGTTYQTVTWCTDRCSDSETLGEVVVTFEGEVDWLCECDWIRGTVPLENTACCVECVDPPIETECCAEPVPASLDVEVVAFTGGGDFQPGCEACLGAGNYPAPLSGTTININYDSGTEIWDGSVSVCGVTLRATLECFDPGFANPFLLRLYVNGVEINNSRLGTGGTFTCSPFYGETSSMVFTSMSDCVSLIATVTEAS